MESLLLCPFAEPERLSDSGGVGGGCGDSGDSNSRDIYRIPGLPSPYGKTILEEGVNITVTAAASGTPTTHRERLCSRQSPSRPNETLSDRELSSSCLCTLTVFVVSLVDPHLYLRYRSSSSMGGTKGIDTSKKFRLFLVLVVVVGVVWWFQQDRLRHRQVIKVVI